MESNYILDNLLLQDEGSRLEFKTSVDNVAIARDITGMINTKGGDILIGLTKEKEIIGIDVSDDLIRDMRSYLLATIAPIAPISFQILKFKDKNLILLSVWEGGKKPYHYENIIYHRQGQNTYQSTGDNLDSIISARKQSDFNWERQALLGVELEDLDIVEVNKTKDAYLKYSNSKSIFDAEDFLIDRGLSINGNITNACMVLFGRNPSKYIPQSSIRLTVYDGIDKTGVFLDDRIFSDHIFSNINSVLEYLSIIYGKTILVDGIRRTQKDNYPLVAIREGLLNAIIHRDYNSSEGFLKISIFSNKTVISNFGSLPEGVAIDDLRVEHNSILRNPDLAHMCFYRELIEMLGTGTIRMINDCKSTGFDSPIWYENENVLELIFPGLGHGKNSSEGVNEGVNEGVKIEFEGINEGVNEGVNEVLNFIRENPNKKAKHISAHLNKGISTIERYLKILKSHDMIEFKGAPKTGGYYAIKP